MLAASCPFCTPARERIFHLGERVIGLWDAYPVSPGHALLVTRVRDKHVLALEEAVRRLTSQPADVFGIRGRGRLVDGHAADVVVFDPATVGCGPLRHVRDFPAGADRLVADARGIRAVIVNGTVIRSENRDAVAPDGPAACCAAAWADAVRAAGPPARALPSSTAGETIRRFRRCRRSFSGAAKARAADHGNPSAPSADSAAPTAGETIRSSWG